MNFKLSHNNYNVRNLEKSVAFYEEALGLKEIRREGPETGEFVIAFLGDGQTQHAVELTYLRDWDREYNLGDNEIHLAFETDDMDAAFEKHKAMGCVCFENKEMGIYFINDPDGFWIEIIPSN